MYPFIQQEILIVPSYLNTWTFQSPTPESFFEGKIQIHYKLQTFVL